jgi:hypothetical protein
MFTNYSRLWIRILLTITISTKQNTSWEANNSHSASQEIPCYGNRNFITLFYPISLRFILILSFRLRLVYFIQVFD